MKVSKLWAPAAALLALALGIGLHAQVSGDLIIVDLPHDVTVGETTLPAGEYELKRDANRTNPVFMIYSNDEMKHETNIIPIHAEEDQVVEDTKVVLEKWGDDYYLTEIWIAGRTTGWEIPLPESARSLESGGREDIVAERQDEPAAEDRDSVAVAEQEQAEPFPAVEEESDAAVAEQDSEAIGESEPLVAQNREEEDFRLQSESEETESSRAAQAGQSEFEDELPATASNWAQFLLLGVVLIGLSAAVRYRWQE